MNRTNLQQLAVERIGDARALLTSNRWSGAYYLAGYSLECAFKACILAHIEATGHIFNDRKYAEKCWTHSLELLVELAELKSHLGLAIQQNPLLGTNWLIAAQWTELSRYNSWSQPQATELVNAIDDAANGVLTWVKNYW